MAVRVRNLPQWLLDLHTGDTPSKTNGLRNHLSKVQVKNGNVHVKLDVTSNIHKEGESNPSSSIADSVATDRVVKNSRQKGTNPKVSPGQRGNKTSSHTCLEMSSSDEEADVKPTNLTSSHMTDTVTTDMSERNSEQKVLKVSPGKPGNNSSSHAHLEMSSSDEEADVKPTHVTSPKGGDGNREGTDVSVKLETSNFGACAETKGTSDNVKRENDAGAAVAEENPEVSTGNENPSLDTASDAEDDQLSNSVSTTANSSSKIIRSKCKYGKTCYRKNSQHRQDFSHPGDDDYTTADNRPECEYGLSCYRKNPLHRQHYKHTRKVQKTRKAKRPKKWDNDSASDDEYDLDDPFIDDASSDDYQPSDNESETDFSVEEAASPSDNSQTNNESKKTRGKRKR